MILLQKNVIASLDLGEMIAVMLLVQMIATILDTAINLFVTAKMDTLDLPVNIFLALIHVPIKDFAIKGFAIVNQDMGELIVLRKLALIIAVIMVYVQ